MNSTGELPYSFPEPNKISIKENREPFPTEHQFSFHRVYDKETPQDVSSARQRGAASERPASSSLPQPPAPRLTFTQVRGP